MTIIGVVCLLGGA